MRKTFGAQPTPAFKLGIALAGVLALAVSSVHADTFGSGGNAFTIDFVPIGNPGNANDAGAGGGIYSRPYGGVSYSYRMGTTEVPQDWITKATNLGLSNVTAGAWGATQPAANMTWYEAAAFVNWLNVSTGHQAAYQLNAGATVLTLWNSAQAWQLDGQNLYRHKDAYYFLPSEDEWYKSAYHKNDGVTANYWDYPTGTNGIPPIGSAIYNSPEPGVDYLGPVDVNLAGDLSPYLTMGQGGNVWEWQESAFDGLNNNPAAIRAAHGGRWDNSEDALQASFHSGNNPNLSIFSVGFRVASILVAGVPGDYNGNGLVDAADYVVWRKGGPLQNEVDNPGTVNASDYNVWRERFGQPAGAGTVVVDSSQFPPTVPEPATLVLLMFAAASWCLLRSRTA